MMSTSDGRLISEEAVDTLKSHLLPLAAAATPQYPRG